MKYRKIEVGDLVWRDVLLFLVVEIGAGYHDGFALCQELAVNPREFWIMKSLLKPV